MDKGFNKVICHNMDRYEIFYHEKSDKLKLYHGIVETKHNSIYSELTWITINHKLINFNHTNKSWGIITDNYIYYGIEIPRDIVKETAMKEGLSVETKDPHYSFEPNATTIFIKSYKRLQQYYNGDK